MADLLTAFATEFARIEQRAADLLRESDPRFALELLDAWESALGLPDPCTGPLTETTARRGAILARLTRLGGAAPAFLEQLAATIGYTVRVVEFRPFEVGRSGAGEPLTNHQIPFEVGRSGAGDPLSNRQAWLWTVDVVAPTATIRRFEVGASGAGESLASWRNDLLECTLRQVAPAHVLMRFVYEEQRSPAQLTASSATRSPRLAMFHDVGEFDMLRYEVIPLTNAVDNTAWLIGAGSTAQVSLASAAFTAEMLCNGGKLVWWIVGAYQNNAGTPVDVFLELYRDADVVPFFTAALEGLPASSTGSGSGQFRIQVELDTRQTDSAVIYWSALFNPRTASAGTTAGGQDTPHRDEDIGRNWGSIDFAGDHVITPKLRKGTAHTSLVNTNQVRCVALVLRDGIFDAG